jgi:hypothetical protein
MNQTVNCEHCGRPLEADPFTIEMANKYAEGRIVCEGCEGMYQLPEDVSECDRAECSNPAPFTIQTDAGPIHRCRSCLILDLTERQWFMFHDE